MYAMAVLINLLGCVWLFTARCEGYNQSWLTSVGDASPLPAEQCWPKQCLQPCIPALHALLRHMRMDLHALPSQMRMDCSCSPGTMLLV